MKIKIFQKDLLHSLNMALKGISNKNTMELLKGILFETYEGRLILTSNNLEIGVQTTLNADIIEEGKIVIDAKIISDIVKKLPEDEIYIEVKEGNIVEIKSGSSQFNIKGFDGKDFPIPNSIEEDYYQEIPSDVFKEMIRKTSFAISQDETKPLLMGELIEINEHSINIVAIDGFRLAIKKCNLNENQKEAKLIIPGKTLIEISRMIHDNDFIKLGFDNKHASFIIGDTILTTRLLEGEFINYNQILPKEFSSKVKINTREFLNALDRASLVAKNSLIKLNIEDDIMKISSRNDEIGNLEEVISIELEGNDLEIAFNLRYFMECIKNIDEENIYLNFNTNVSPCILNPENDDSYTYLLLPVRI
ncbi:DNA polymerase-3 subunit beta [Acetoanaerobium pronyense]|uniref:Beta sliding clamp n=1 Tax=Acetoanaerobium pronyense TaxID=1482736 RepID=A0ABS4KPL9_9FIRM|nr:DNA polymerase III subunit beta [Acetoanaerobium pronyense]MBP2028564.1 DNA polymerase-3 subunit beta [Acetoanaerobium pronyense]